MSEDFNRTIKASMRMKSVIEGRILWLKGMASESNNMQWEDAQAEFSTSRDRIEGVTVRGLRSSRGKEMKPRFVFAEDVLEDDVYQEGQ